MKQPSQILRGFEKAVWLVQITPSDITPSKIPDF